MEKALIGASWPGRSKENGMKPDPVGQEIRKLASVRGYRLEVEQITDLDGESRRFWWFSTRRGQPLTNGDGQGLQDAAALEFLQHGKY
jgi:hypothetical protein